MTETDQCGCQYSESCRHKSRPTYEHGHDMNAVTKPADPFAALSRPDRELLIEACNYADWWLEERCEDNKKRKEFQRLKKMLEVKP